MGTDTQNRLSYFDYRGRGFVEHAECANTLLHRDLCNKGYYDNKLVTVNNRPPVFGSTDISGIDWDGAPLDTWMARAQARILSQEGVHIPTGEINRYRESLVSSHLLSSSLCVAEVNTQRGAEYQIVTKSREVLSGLYPALAPSVKKKGLDRYGDRMVTQSEELVRGFKVVRVFSETDGLHLVKSAIRSKSGLHPYYAVNNYAKAIVHLLSQQKVVLVFDLDGVVHKIITTLDTGVVAKWMGASVAEAEAAISTDWLCPLSLGYLGMPDLTVPGQFVSVPLLRIHSIKRYE
ncbi:hypothetical protein [Brevibacillus brevis]|uniref:hypothetical protein n=1 Tax=Brevibacillus brevis TaxID=1393 RepID=UPI0037C5A5A9